MDSPTDYNELLRQISKSLENARISFGTDSRQYQTILQILKECLRDFDEKDKRVELPVVDADLLSFAMGFLNLE